jgi:hypothetical protein
VSWQRLQVPSGLIQIHREDVGNKIPMERACFGGADF